MNLYDSDNSFKIKWINDVIVLDGENYRKISGTLCTCSNDSHGNIFLSIGIGVNLNYSPQIDATNTCNLAELCGTKIDVD